MKMSKILSLLLVAVMLVACFAACAPASNQEEDSTSKPDGTNNPAAGLEGTYKITMWVSEKEGVADLFKQQIAAFEAKYPGIKIEASVEGVTEGDAGSKVVADVATAPDIYCFAQDQLARLVQAAALAAPGKNAQANIKETNDAGSVAAATVAGTIYAYPMTSDNGYFMYYDKSIISDEDAESLEKIIAACEKSGKKIRYALENSWYTASFFFATGCHSNWTMDADGNFNAVDDTFNSAEGLIAMKGMQMLAHSSAYDSNADIFTDAAVVVTGIWNAEAAAQHFGANMGATDLPSFTVDGKTYHLGSYTGNKLMGVKPQTDAKRGAVLSLLAQYLTGEECQNQRFEKFQWGPSNKNAQASDAVQANPSLAALAKQGEYGQPQGQIHGGWWDIAKVLGADAKAAADDAALQNALNNYDKAIERILTLSPEQLNAWTIIGGIGGANWDTDFEMIQEPEGVWTSKDTFTLEAGQEFKVRKGLSWDLAYGNGPEASSNEPNFVVETAGKYKIQLVTTGENTGIVLIPQ